MKPNMETMFRLRPTDGMNTKLPTNETTMPEHDPERETELEEEGQEQEHDQRRPGWRCR